MPIQLPRGKVTKTTTEIVYGVTSLLPDEVSPEQLLDWVREYWWIQGKQHYRRDHTQREDHCQVRNTVAARNLSLLRSGAIFLFEQQGKPEFRTNMVSAPTGPDAIAVDDVSQSTLNSVLDSPS